jgi:choline dehydrogenase-like flavoprotein
VLIDALSLAPDASVETDLCIAGAGAAGIAIAREMIGRKLRVCLLEGGGLTPDDATQSLYRGTSMARKYFPLDATRTRYFGGSTNCWSGFCRPLDADDFEQRDWIPHSGWPFDRAALLPYYRRAQKVCKLGPFRYQGDECASERRPLLTFADGRVVTRCFQIAPTRFGQIYRDEIASAANIDTYLRANVVEIEPTEGARAVKRLHVRTLGGNAFEVRPKVVVLATGGIENARLLLASRRVQPAGLGNQHDLVGRFFMEHPHTLVGELLPSAGARRLGLYLPHRRGEVGELGILSLSPETRRSERLANFTCSLTGPAEFDAFERGLAAAAADIDAPRRAERGLPARAGKYVLSNESEQVPNPDSRVELSYERDALGMNRVKLKWRLTAQDKRSLRRSHEILARELGRSGVGRLKLALGGDDDTWPPDLVGARHHMGTTRMNPDPKRGVVDANGRVHGIANLFVAGSSVFPTSGSANPTFTLVALALRLAHHLKERFA